MNIPSVWPHWLAHLSVSYDYIKWISWSTDSTVFAGQTLRRKTLSMAAAVIEGIIVKDWSYLSKFRYVVFVDPHLL